MNMLRSRTLVLLFLVLTCCLPTSPAESRLNLPQSRQVVQLGDTTRTALRDSISRPLAAAGLPAPLQNSILQNMPEEFRNDCRSLMDAWAGERGRDSSMWSVRLLDRQGDRVWLAYQCGSSLKDADMARYYDERLALLHLGTGTIELLSPGQGAEESEGVLHYEFANQLDLKNATGYCFRLTVGNNPCCDGPEYRSQERLVIFIDTANGARESLSVVTGRKDSSHSDDPEVDTETAYHADITFERDTNDLVTAASVAFHEKIVDTTWEANKANPHTVSEHSGTLKFKWNPSSFEFDEIR
jgi:hypothetical protein